MQYPSRIHYMKWQTRKKRYKGFHCSFDPINMTAHSAPHYGAKMEWKFLAKYDNKIVLNLTRFSQSSSSHQNKVYRVMEELNITPDIMLFTVTENLCCTEDPVALEITNLTLVVKGILKIIDTPRTHLITNANRSKKLRVALDWLRHAYIFKGQMISIQELFDSFNPTDKVKGSIDYAILLGTYEDGGNSLHKYGITYNISWVIDDWNNNRL